MRHLQNGGCFLCVVKRVLPVQPVRRPEPNFSML